MNAKEILRELVAIPTPSAVSNLPLLAWVERFLEAHGWHVQLLPYTDENGVSKANLIARPTRAPKDETPIDLAFVCHTDTVPFSTSWTAALDLCERLDSQSLHGCGACDVKGALACFLSALEDIAPPQLLPGVALFLTADEEIGCKGMDRLLAESSVRIRSAIVSEPTCLRPGIAGKGYGLARVTIHGQEAHSAYPGEGVSAIALAARFITRIENLGRGSVADSSSVTAADGLFEPPRTTLNVGVIQGGTAKNIVAGACTFLVEWRPIPADPPRDMFTQLESLADTLRAEEPQAQIHLELLRAEPGFAASVVGPLQRRLAELAAETSADRAQPTHAPSRAPVGISFGSEASRLAPFADEVIVIGPGDMHTAHSDRECVPLQELAEWTRILRNLLVA
jgi:acetylornithine deacetylase